MFEITTSCSGLPEEVGRTAIADVLEEFAERPWQRDVACWWENGLLFLRARNDADRDGEALAHEFSDVVCACTPIVEEISICVVSVTELPGSDA